jgi:hypothetical protein
MAKLIGDRISTEDHEKSTTIIVLPKRVRWKDIIFTTWVLGFTFAGCYMVYLLFFGGINDLNVGENFDEDVRRQQLIYLTIFVSFWAYFEYITVKALLWTLFGKEMLMIDSEALHVKRSILNYGKSHRYFFENIKKFRVENTNETSLNKYLDNAYWSGGSDSIKLEYQGKQKSFGRKLDDKNANLLLRFINNRIKKRKKRG